MQSWGESVERTVVEQMLFPAGDHRHGPTGLLEVRVVSRGSSYAIIDLGAGDQRVFTRPGDVMVSMPDQGTRFCIDDQRQVTLLRLPRPDAERRLAALGASLEQLAPLGRRPFREPLIAELLRRLATRVHGERLRDAAIDVIIGTLARQAGQGTKPRGAPVLTARALSRVTQAIEDSLAQAWTVERLAALAGLPRRTFAAEFRDATGLPVLQYVVRQRVERAVALIRTTTMRLADVAAATGFASQTHMHGAVVRYRGVTPGSLRETT